MKVGKYTLEADGTVPTFVFDGGYLSVASGLPSPQDWTFVGIVEDDAPVETFANRQALLDYMLDNGGADWVDLEGNPVNLESMISFVDEETISWVVSE